MNEETAVRVQEALRTLFEQEFKIDMARITLTGAITFDAEKSFGLWFQLSERLRKSNPALMKELTKYLKRYYAGKTQVDVNREENRRAINGKKSGDLFYEAILEHTDDDF